MSQQFISDQKKSIKSTAQRPTASASAVQHTKSTTQVVTGGLTQAQRSVLAAQSTIGNQAVIRRMVQRDADDLPPADSPTASQSIEAGGNSVSVSPSGVSIQSSGPLSLSAPAITMSAPTVTSDAALTSNQGVTRTNTLIADSVVGASYTPGAGNVW